MFVLGCWQPHLWYRRPQHVDRGAPEADGPPPQPHAAVASGSPRTSREYPPAAVPAAEASHESSAPSIAPNRLLDSQGLLVRGVKIFESSAVGDPFNPTTGLKSHLTLLGPSLMWTLLAVARVSRNPTVQWF